MVKATNIYALKGVWYLDLYASHYLTNNKYLSINKFWPKCLDFITAGRQTICTENIDTIAISLVNKLSIKLERVAYIPEYDLNLISLC